jgi:hypothetical protein
MKGYELGEVRSQPCTFVGTLIVLFGASGAIYDGKHQYVIEHLLDPEQTDARPTGYGSAQVASVVCCVSGEELRDSFASSHRRSHDEGSIVPRASGIARPLTQNGNAMAADAGRPSNKLLPAVPPVRCLN